jgi:hypothetical protein
MKVALRVLTAISIREEPAELDVAILRDAVNPDEHDYAPDELACIVINAALRRRN